MASITKRGNSFAVRYAYTDEKGKVCAGWETCKTETEAKKRKREIEYELDKGTFLIPSDMTVRELLEKWIGIQSRKHRWAPKTYQSTESSIQNLICPYIGDVAVQSLTQYRIEEFYSTLAQTPCAQYVQGQRRELSPKQQQRLLSGTTLHAVHWILKSACAYALEWGIIQKSPIPHDLPISSFTLCGIPAQHTSCASPTATSKLFRATPATPARMCLSTPMRICRRSRALL